MTIAENRDIKLKVIMKELLLFSMPLVLSGILQQLYNWVDAFIVGNVIGETALGAIGATGTITGFYLFVITGFTLGLSVLSGQKYGGKQIEFISRLLSTYTILFGCIFLVLALLGSCLTMTVLTLLHTPEDILFMATDYLKIILLGVPFLAVYNVLSAILRGVGDSKAPFYSILVSSIVNVILDVIFVVVLRKGIIGAAVATILSQIVMTIFLLFYVSWKHSELKPKKRARLLVASAFREGLHFGVPPMIQSCVTAFGNILLQNFMNGFGADTVVAITTAYRIDTLALLPIVNLGSAISTLTAQSCGANEKERTAKTKKAGILLMIAVSLTLTVLVIPSGSRLIRLFGAGEEAVLIGHRFFVRLAAFYLIFGLGIAVSGYLQGIGDVKVTSMIGIIMLTTRVITSYACPTLFGNMIIAYAEAFSWILGLVLYILRMKIKSQIK